MKETSKKNRDGSFAQINCELWNVDWSGELTPKARHWKLYIQFNDSLLENGFEGVRLNDLDASIGRLNNIYSHYVLGKKEDDILHFNAYLYPSDNSYISSFKFIRDPETGLYLGGENIIEVEEKRILCSGGAKANILELEGSEKQMQVLMRISEIISALGVDKESPQKQKAYNSDSVEEVLPGSIEEVKKLLLGKSS